ncbi:MAG: hypothetical protein IKT30_06615 [Bacteroidaceae bacterium]|nr:hypothetical protein [Bacteroidaceae bacterium]
MILPVETEVDIEIKEHKERRSLNANAYFHRLVDELRQALRISFAACKNQLITSYGQIEYIGDNMATIKTNITPEEMLEVETLHCKLISVADEDGVFWYRVYRGTHTYDTKEMSILIDGTVEECKAQGIETMTPNELERLKGYEKQSYR